jgi:hypothetical protein
MTKAERQGRIRVGIGGWSYTPWRGVFYPKGLKQADELAYAGSRLTSIETVASASENRGLFWRLSPRGHGQCAAPWP